MIVDDDDRPFAPGPIIDAIRHGAEAGKLRAYVRENGGELAGLERLADRHSAASRRAVAVAMQNEGGRNG